MATWYDIADNGTVYVRVGSLGLVQTNPDPLDPAYLWTTRTSGTTNDLYAVAWNGTTFVAVGESGTTLYSADGITWTAGTGATETLFDVETLENVCVAVGENGAIEVSQWGDLWTAVPSGTAEHLRGVSVGNSQYIAVGDAMTVVVGNLTSTNPYVNLVEDVFLPHTMDDAGSSMNHVLTTAIDVNVQTQGYDFIDNGGGGGGNTTVLFNSYREPNQNDLAGLSHTQVAEAYNSNVLGEALALSVLLQYVTEDALTETVNLTDGDPWRYGTPSTSLGGGTEEMYRDPDTGELYAPESAGVWMGLGATVLENLEIDEPVLTAQKTVNATMAEDVEFTPTATSTMTFAIITSETVELSPTATSAQIFELVLSEQAAFGIGLTRAGETYTGVVMNMSNKAVTEYSNYNFNSLGSWNAVSYGATDTDIYQLTGADDAGTNIASYLVTALTTMGTRYTNRVERAYLGLRNDGTVHLRIVARQDDDTKVSHIYSLTETGNTLRRERVKLGRGVRATYWQFELRNEDGADFELDEMVFIPIVLQRRIT